MSIVFGECQFEIPVTPPNGNVLHETGSQSLQRLGPELWIWESPASRWDFVTELMIIQEVQGLKRRGQRTKPWETWNFRVRTEKKKRGSKREGKGVFSEVRQKSREENASQIEVVQ